MSLSGVKHITIAPALLRELHSSCVPTHQSDGTSIQSLFNDEEYLRKVAESIPEKPFRFIEDEEGFRISFTRRDDGKQEIKQVKAINVFCDMQLKLEEIVQKYLE